MAIKKTIFHLEVNSREYDATYTGTFKFPETKIDRKHDERIMSALMANEELLNFLYRLVTPVVRCKRREARKAARKAQTITPLNSAKS